MSCAPSRTVIFFDDDVGLMKAFAALLSPAGYEAHLAPDELTLQRLLERPVVPSILFVDYSLLAEASAAFIASLKDKYASALSGCRIVGWSSLDSETARSLDPAFFAAVFAFCEKPFDEDELLAVAEKFSTKI